MKRMLPQIIICFFVCSVLGGILLTTTAQGRRDQYDKTEFLIGQIRTANREIKAEARSAGLTAEMAADTVADLQAIIEGPRDEYQLEKLTIRLQGLAGQITGFEAAVKFVVMESDKIEEQTKGDY